jgi:hypothetical protein
MNDRYGLDGERVRLPSQVEHQEYGFKTCIHNGNYGPFPFDLAITTSVPANHSHSRGNVGNAEAGQAPPIQIAKDGCLDAPHDDHNDKGKKENSDCSSQ